MIRILIVDDEHVERKALKVIIEKYVDGIEVIGQAENGKQAVQLAHDLQPDLILIDIKMPGMDGLQATKTILEFQQHVKFIIVSAYDTFEYARKAMQMGVREYLLKPSKTQEIVEIVKKVVLEIQEEKFAREQQEADKEKWRMLAPIVETDLVTQLLYDHTHEMDVPDLLHFIGMEKVNRAFVLIVFIQRDGERLNERPNEGYDRLYKDIKEAFHRQCDGWVGAMAGHKIPLVVISNGESSYRAQATIITRKLLQIADRYENVRLFVGIGGEYERLDQLRQSYYEALIASSEMRLPSRHVFYADRQAADKGQPSEEPYSEAWEKEMLDDVKEGRFTVVSHKLSELICRYEADGRPIAEAKQKVQEILSMMTVMMEAYDVPLEKLTFSTPIQHFRVLLSETYALVDKMAEAQEVMTRQFSPSLAKQVEMYIREYGHERISLEMIAERIGMNPYYASKWFKETFGKNYVEYLTEYRLEKAKQLMMDERKTLKEIAIDVGYRDPNYFSRVFKKVNGISAKAYRQRLLSEA